MEKNVLFKIFLVIIFIIFSLGVAFYILQPVSPSTAQIVVPKIDGDMAYVTQAFDGDTIEVNVNGEIKIVRYIGIDTPETVDPRRPVGCFGKEASNENKNLVEGKTVILQKDISDTDKYNRLLRYVLLPLSDGKILFVNDYLIREGFALSSTYPPDLKYNEQFLNAERQARENNVGLWGSCDTLKL